MKKQKDAFGQEMWAFYQGKASIEIVEREDGYIDTSHGARAYLNEYRKWPKMEKQALKHAKGLVLDIGAGAGRVALYLQGKGLDVMAIDNSPLALKVCKARGVKKTRLLPIEKIHTLKPDTFDTIILFGNNFGLLKSFRQAQVLLKRMYRITTPKAKILAQSNDIYDTKNPDHLTYHKYNQQRGRMSGQLKLRIRFQKCIGEWFDYLMVSQKEMQEIVKGTGWKISRFYNSEGPAYVVVLEKV